jgi:hypothetical protein
MGAATDNHGEQQRMMGGGYGGWWRSMMQRGGVFPRAWVASVGGGHLRRHGARGLAVAAARCREGQHVTAETRQWCGDASKGWQWCGGVSKGWQRRAGRG